MKIIFLDFDGVLTDRHWLQKEDSRGDLSPKLVDRLNSIVRQTGACVVVTSTWRILHNLDQIKTVLDRAGFIGEVVGLTPGGGGRRGPQIREWIYEHAFQGPFVILDDDSDMDELADKLVKTDFEVGLQNEHVRKAVEVLSR